MHSKAIAGETDNGLLIMVYLQTVKLSGHIFDWRASDTLFLSHFQIHAMIICYVCAAVAYYFVFTNGRRENAEWKIDACCMPTANVIIFMAICTTKQIKSTSFAKNRDKMHARYSSRDRNMHIEITCRLARQTVQRVCCVLMTSSLAASPAHTSHNHPSFESTISHKFRFAWQITAVLPVANM